jgi:flagellar biosynthesis protein FlhB
MSRRGDQPTEAPTPHRLAEARRRGELAPSPQLGAALALAAGFAALVALGPAGLGQLVSYLASALGRAPAGYAAGQAARLALVTACRVLALPLGAVFLASAGAGLLQTGGRLVSGPLRPDLGRLSPSAALRKMFSVEAAWQLARGVVAVALVLAVAGLTLRWQLPELVALAGAPAARVLAGFGALARRLAGRVVLAALLIGAAEDLLARARRRRSLRMTRQEVLDERRETEGDPAGRAERRRLHRQLAEPAVADEALEDDLGRADVVVVDPRRLAIALRYERGGPSAPVVIARGPRRRAEPMVEAARAAGVPIVADASLARALGELAEGDEIPEALYESVAEILRTISLPTGREAG